MVKDTLPAPMWQHWASHQAPDLPHGKKRIESHAPPWRYGASPVGHLVLDYMGTALVDLIKYTAKPYSCKQNILGQLLSSLLCFMFFNSFFNHSRATIARSGIQRVCANRAWVTCLLYKNRGYLTILLNDRSSICYFVFAYWQVIKVVNLLIALSPTSTHANCRWPCETAAPWGLNAAIVKVWNSRRYFLYSRFTRVFC